MDRAELPLPGNKPLWQQIHDVLEHMIIHRELEPGQRLREKELSERFGVRSSSITLPRSPR